MGPHNIAAPTLVNIYITNDQNMLNFVNIKNIWLALTISKNLHQWGNLLTCNSQQVTFKSWF